MNAFFTACIVQIIRVKKYTVTNTAATGFPNNILCITKKNNLVVDILLRGNIFKVNYDKSLKV